MESSQSESGLKMEIPFTLKVGQVMTGFGIGCGIGIGVGRPLNLGAIPGVDQVMSATRGATTAFSGLGRHMNGFISRMGFKSIEAGIGCGLGFGHGFGVGVAIKPGVVQHVQSCLVQGLARTMKNWKIMPDISSVGKFGATGSIENSVRLASETAGKALGSPIGNGMQIASQTAERALQSPIGSTMHLVAQSAERGLKDPATGSFTANTSETFLSNFVQGTSSQTANKMAFDEEVGRLQLENKILQMLLRHQQLIEELKQENTNLRHVLVEELNVSPDKLLESNCETENYSKNNVADCFECRRRARRRTQ